MGFGGASVNALAAHERRTEADPFYDGPPRCTCGRYWPCEFVVTPPVPVEPAVSDEARRIGLKAMVEVGCLLYSAERSDRYGAGIGGVVVEIVEGGVDSVTGEATPRRYRCLRMEIAGVDFVDLSERELTEDSVKAPNGRDLRMAYRKLAADVGKAKGMGTPYEVDRLRWAHELAVIAVMGGRAW